MCNVPFDGPRVQHAPASRPGFTDPQSASDTPSPGLEASNEPKRRRRRPAPDNPGPIVPLFRLADWARMLNVSRRTVERMLAAGKLPPPDLRIGAGEHGSPRWRSEATVIAWIEKGGRS